ncbi:hyoscyamine 6-dioxygenase-like [Lotus japonicus]|uniref:hyoscyamine 6-dioxygenase-like n=1 Tax=Lotus japonicus TaxID=34305 RepID=UPI0025890CB9|nr:hyoscyamine 6-dioxygenase-like [Lotus japonicus]
MESLDQRLVSSWFHGHSSVPPTYVQPLESRPGCRFMSPSCMSIPVIDLGDRHNDRADTIKHILKASEQYGFFQVINHRVSKDLVEETLNVFKEFHAMPPKEKVNECSKDPIGRCKMYTSSENYEKDAIKYWKDSLTHPCPPSGEYMQYWPDKPTKYREVVGKYTQEMRKLGHEILELLSEGLGLDPSYFHGKLSKNPQVLQHHYPPCPEPSLTLGIAKHRDTSIITILLQEQDVQGLQVLKDGEWLRVDPIPNAFVVNIGLLLQVISNGRLVGAEHRVVTNSTMARTSVAYFIYPSLKTIIEPAQCLLNNGTTLPMYKSMPFGEFRTSFLAKFPKFEEELRFK